MSLSSDKNEAWEKFTRQGSAEAFEEIYKEMSDALFSYGHCLTQDKSLVDDAIQDIFIDLWKRRNHLDAVKKFRPYIFQALRNNIHTQLLKKTRNVSLLAAGKQPLYDPSFEQSIITREERNYRHRLLEKAIDCLPSRQKEILFLKFFEGYCYSEISAILSIKPQVARNLASRAIKKIRAHLFTNAEKFWIITFLPTILSFF